MSRAPRLTRALLDKAQQRMRPVLQRFLMNVIEGKAPNSDLKDQYHSLIYQVGCNNRTAFLIL